MSVNEIIVKKTDYIHLIAIKNTEKFNDHIKKI